MLDKRTPYSRYIYACLHNTTTAMWPYLHLQLIAPTVGHSVNHKGHNDQYANAYIETACAWKHRFKVRIHLYGEHTLKRFNGQKWNTHEMTMTVMTMTNTATQAAMLMSLAVWRMRACVVCVSVFRQSAPHAHYIINRHKTHTTTSERKRMERNETMINNKHFNAFSWFSRFSNK